MLLGTLRNLVSMGVIGWFFAGLAIAAGHAYGLADARFARRVVVLGLYVLVLGTLGLVAAKVTGASSLLVRAPLGYLLPPSPTTDFYFTVALFSTEESFGEVATRLILFFPWPTMLAMGSVAIAAISLRDRSWTWRGIGFAGGTLGVVFSWSRTGLLAFVVVIAAEFFLRLDRLSRSLLVALALLGLFGLFALGFDPINRAVEARAAVDFARVGSSEARALIYRKSWEGFLQSPLVGWGWIGPSVHPKENLPIGSHSTFYGLAYTGGALTLGAFFLAMAATLLATVRVALGPDETGAGRTAFLLALTLAVFCPYEMLFSFSLPCLFLFVWIGGALRQATDGAGRSNRERGDTA
ncbi:MAG: O-antigen ligase family protein [Geminicoccaceae bacterium]